jgi:hypothetical protein
MRPGIVFDDNLHENILCPERARAFAWLESAWNVDPHEE